MTNESQERQAIEKAVQTYLDGLYEGDTEKLARVFHPTSALTGDLGGKLTIVPRDQWLEAVRTAPRRSRRTCRVTTRSCRSTSPARPPPS